MKYAAATAIAASSVACTPEVITQLQESEIVKQSLEMEDAQSLVGVVLFLPEENSITV